MIDITPIDRNRQEFSEQNAGPQGFSLSESVGCMSTGGHPLICLTLYKGFLPRIAAKY